jgi:DNA-binding transcriptional ArsR family regulator
MIHTNMETYITIWKVFLPVVPKSPMALHDYVAEVLGSKANVRVLRALVRYRGKVFTVRELAKAADLSHPQASKVLKGLESRGVVRLQPVGRAYQVSLKDESYVLKSVIEPVFAAERDTVDSLVSTIRPFFEDERILSVAIFGSVARGLERETRRHRPSDCRGRQGPCERARRSGYRRRPFRVRARPVPPDPR